MYRSHSLSFTRGMIPLMSLVDNMLAVCSDEGQKLTMAFAAKIPFALMVLVNNPLTFSTST